METKYINTGFLALMLLTLTSCTKEKSVSKWLYDDSVYTFFTIDSFLKADGDSLKLSLIANDTIRYLPEAVVRANKLTSLTIINCPNLDVDSTFKMLARSKLTSLVVSNHNVKSLPESIGLLRTLTNLNIEGEEMSSIPDEIGELVNLRSLKIMADIKELPVAFNRLRHLKYFDLSSKYISIIPNVICDLHSLEILNLIYCNIEDVKAFPLCLVSLGSLKEIRIDRTPFGRKELESYYKKGRFINLGKLQNMLPEAKIIVISPTPPK